jgi:hypothetical protein
MKFIALAFSIFLFSALASQPLDIFNQNFKSAKSMVVWSTQQDSAGVTVKPKSKLYSFEFDTAGRIVNKIRWSGFLKDSIITFTYDSLGRVAAKKVEHASNVVYYYWTYELNPKTGATIRYTKRGKETIEVSAIWRDTLNNMSCESTWIGRTMSGIPESRKCFNASGKLVVSALMKANIYNDYKYDDQNNLESVKTSTSVVPSSVPPYIFTCENEYNNSELIKYTYLNRAFFFTYNSSGLISSQKVLDLKTNTSTFYECVYLSY